MPRYASESNANYRRRDNSANRENRREPIHGVPLLGDCVRRVDHPRANDGGTVHATGVPVAATPAHAAPHTAKHDNELIRRDGRFLQSASQTPTNPASPVRLRLDKHSGRVPQRDRYTNGAVGLTLRPILRGRLDCSCCLIALRPGTVHPVEIPRPSIAGPATATAHGRQLTPAQRKKPTEYCRTEPAN